MNSNQSIDMATALAQAQSQARRIRDFWAARGVSVQVEIVRHYQEFLVRSNLTGQEPCESIRVRPVKLER